jgi:sugar phosphate isomerase/epimerase
MRLGGSVTKPYDSPEQWLAVVEELGYSAVIVPVNGDASPEEIDAYLQCARGKDLLFGEVGAWKNVLSPAAAEQKAAMDYVKKQLWLAEEFGARCCVNIAGARGAVWDGCYADNYAPDTYALIVDTVREIIDAVNPKRTFYTLEPMPWMHPDSPEDYLQLLRDVDRPAFGVHLDYTNMINSVEKYLNSSDFIRHCFRLLGPYTKSIHAKDVTIGAGLPCQICEALPGEGSIDFGLVLRLAEELGNDMPVYVEHLDSHEAYKTAASFLRTQALQAGIPVKNCFAV